MQVSAVTTVACLSDTHLRHGDITVPDADILIHAGDACGRGEGWEVADFHEWMFSLPHRHKVYVPGNHDWDCERRPMYWRAMFASLGMHCLIDEAVEIEGLRIYGSPWQPEFCQWAFNVERGRKLAAIWSRIPADTQVLVTHGPPAGILDVAPSDRGVGCHDLRRRVGQLADLKLHVFGHVHHSAGQMRGHRNALFVNAAICDERYEPSNPVQVVEL